MQPENLEARVTALETQVRDLTGEVRATSQDAAAARVLASNARLGVTEIRDELRDFRRATDMSLMALRRDMNDGFRRVDERFARVDSRFAEIRAQFDMTAAGQQRIIELIQTVIDGQGRRRPMKNPA
ncbi:hypothetical protein H7K14_04380 [Mycolicibacter longobardus]|uniref:hypothetical protein n=1 Tax=Mycolicibacter longobardus TaxID=1108812 RepID=UPI0021F3388A|nr:hypothetical protein [Mycolicibacter longobardus]MCV7383066.1 hypothetical protein [Mycolicibacter longobardus]